MLRETFDGLADSRQAHRDDHRRVHRRGNAAIHADDHANLAAAVAAAAQYKIPHVMLNPRGIYTLSETLTLPTEICLDGGGPHMASLGSARLRAEITATQPLDPMIRLSNYTSVRGCYLNGGRQAAGAIFGQGTIYNWISGCLIANTTAYGFRFGGALYTTIKRNIMQGIGGYGLDALQAYGPQGSYYGLNVGLSEGNSYLNCGIRIEGILTSLQDDFEGKFDQPWVKVGGTVQSQVAMYGAYMEMKAGTRPIEAVTIDNSSKFSLRDAAIYGQKTDAEAVFLSMSYPCLIHVSGCSINRFSTVFSGAVATNSNVAIFGNHYTDSTLVNAITNLATAESVFCVWPGDRIGVP